MKRPNAHNLLRSGHRSAMCNVRKGNDVFQWLPMVFLEEDHMEYIMYTGAGRKLNAIGT